MLLKVVDLSSLGVGLVREKEQDRCRILLVIIHLSVGIAVRGSSIRRQIPNSVEINYSPYETTNIGFGVHGVPKHPLSPSVRPDT
jgi:hypothetical protein